LAATQLVEIGLFPCAPYRPTLAVDINVLDFARLLFLNISPNVTAWCKATEAFLMARSHKINYSDNLRKRFGYALLWYTHLHNAVTKHVDRVLALARRPRRGVRTHATPPRGSPSLDSSEPPSSPTPHAPPSSSRLGRRGRRARAPATGSPTPNRDGPPPRGSPLDHAAPVDAPTDYLRSRCPACFG
ncbi:hypothetical protein EV715DRAFT_163516, partial [Schizophyllum commune]